MAENIIKSLRQKDNRTISKCISMVENQSSSYLDFLSSIISILGNKTNLPEIFDIPCLVII